MDAFRDAVSINMYPKQMRNFQQFIRIPSTQHTFQSYARASHWFAINILLGRLSEGS